MNHKKRILDIYLIISTLVAVILILSSLYFFNGIQKDDVLQFVLFEMIKTAGISLLVANFVTLTERHFSTTPAEQIKEVITSEFRSLNITTETGIKKVSLCKTVQDFSEMIENASSLDFLYHTGTKLYERYEGSIRMAIKNGCRVRVLVGDPNNALYTKGNEDIEKILAAFDTRNLKNPDVSLTDINRTISTIQAIKKSDAMLHVKGNLDMRGLTCLPTGSLFIVNGSYCYFVPYIPYEVSLNSICFEFSNNGSQYFQLFHHYFKNAWEHGVKME